MKFSEVKQSIGQKVTLNGRGDLAMDSVCRHYIYPKPEIPFLFTIEKITRKGLVLIKCLSDNVSISVPAMNIDLLE
jgi:hypothetical protein